MSHSTHAPGPSQDRHDRRAEQPASHGLLVVAAFPPELAPLRRVLGDGLRGRIGQHDVAAVAVGIGLAQASVGAALRIGEERPSAVVLIGTCGVYAGAGPGVGDVVVARSLFLVDPAVVDGASQFPAPMSIRTESDGALRAALVAAGGVACDVATTLAVTVDDALASRVARAVGAQAEHLEAHGVATACEALGVRFAAALGVANVVGSRAREQWRSHHPAASEAAARVVAAWIEQLSAEPP